MDHSMERWYSAARQRFSVRKYDGAPSAEDIASLNETAKLLSVRGVRIEVAEAGDAFAPQLLWYGKIKGATHVAAFIANDATDMAMLGYMGEAFILEATALGLGTCWIGMTYRKGALKKQLSLADGERIVCVTPLGVGAEQFTRRPRKTIAELTGLEEAHICDLPEWQRLAVECGRIAPSAINRQPWSFSVKSDRMIVEQAKRNFGYERIDCGIAMLHMELGAAHGGVFGDWDCGDKRFSFTSAAE